MKSDAVKYLLIGLAIGIALMLLIGAGSGSIGRYQIYVMKKFDGNDVFYILDTQTGIAISGKPGLSLNFNKDEEKIEW